MPARIWRCLVAEVDFETQELVGLGHALGDLDLRDAQLDLGEVVDGDFFSGDLVGAAGAAVASRSRCIGGDGRRCCLLLLRQPRGRLVSTGVGAAAVLGRLGGRAGSRQREFGGCGRCSLFDLLHTGDCVLFCAGEDGADLAELCAGLQAAPG